MSAGRERPRTIRIGLCLSAGGFRSALYEVGVLRYLAEASLLPRVVSISAISGGAVLGAWLAQRWRAIVDAPRQPEGFRAVAASPFSALLADTNIRNRWLAAWLRGRLRGPGHGRGTALADVLARQVLSSQPLSTLPGGVDLVITATDLVSGGPFHFARDVVGSALHGYGAPPPTLRLATAVAAAAATPEYISPIHLRGGEVGLQRVSLLALVDGAVYDSLGTEWFEDARSRRRPRPAPEPDFLIVVDGAGPLETAEGRHGSMRTLLRSPRVSRAHMRSERTNHLRDRFARGELHGVIASMSEPLPKDVPFPLNQAEVVDGLARLRTDLDRFLPREADLLGFAGYWTIHTCLRAHAPRLSLRDPAWRQLSGCDDLRSLRHTLAWGRHRVAPGRIL